MITKHSIKNSMHHRQKQEKPDLKIESVGQQNSPLK